MTLRFFGALLCAGVALAAACGGTVAVAIPETSSAPASPEPGGDGGDSGGDGASTADGAPNVDAGADATVDGGAEASGIFCGTIPSTGATQLCALGSTCCAQQATCFADAGDPCGDDFALHCDEKADCPTGLQCCMRPTQIEGGGMTGVANCRPEPCAAKKAWRFCNPTQTPDECVSIGKSCKPHPTMTGYSICQ